MINDAQLYDKVQVKGFLSSSIVVTANELRAAVLGKQAVRCFALAKSRHIEGRRPVTVLCFHTNRERLVTLLPRFPNRSRRFCYEMMNNSGLFALDVELADGFMVKEIHKPEIRRHFAVNTTAENISSISLAQLFKFCYIAASQRYWLASSIPRSYCVTLAQCDSIFLYILYIYRIFIY